jgi:PTS system nitrogen regulatory IIA component
MRLSDLLSAERVAIKRGAADGFDKSRALTMLSSMLAAGAKVDAAAVEHVLVEREALQSTGIGDGVAIPHGAMAELDAQHAALLIVPDGVDFAAIDGTSVTLLFAVVGPKRATGEHLKTLARISRLLRNKEFRDRLIHATDAAAAYALVSTEEGERT